MMVTHTITPGHKARLLLDADSIQKAVINGFDIKDKYDVKCQCFALDFDDTSEMTAGELLLEYTRAGEKITEKQILETTNAY